MRTCEDIFINEGFNSEDFDGGANLWVAKDERGDVEAFYAWRMEGNLPYLVHFATAFEKRTPRLAYRLWNHFKKTMRSFGYPKVIINVKSGPYMERLVETFFKTKPYAENDGHKFYLVTI